MKRFLRKTSIESKTQAELLLEFITLPVFLMCLVWFNLGQKIKPNHCSTINNVVSRVCKTSQSGLIFLYKRYVRVWLSGQGGN